jgi:NhaP-type Na+/H+ or K+/H+ antiporter
MSLSATVILSFFFNHISRKTKIPSVILLMLLGVGLTFVLGFTSFELPNIQGPLKILGTVGLMLIVLEGALDLKITRNRIPMILRAVASALVILLTTTLLIAGLIVWVLQTEFLPAVVYAVPLSVISSAIVIPSIKSLRSKKREFLVYESTASDILGILLFDFIVFEPPVSDTLTVPVSIVLTTVVSIVLAIVLSYLLVIALKRLDIKVKTFLFLSALALIFSAGKYFHLPTLLIVLMFGIILKNQRVFFIGPMKRFLDYSRTREMVEGFELITQESAFLLRTFFFVFFGMTLGFAEIVSPTVIVLGLGSLLVIYFLRFINLKVISKQKIFPQILIAPRGLVSILLFYKIPDAFVIPSFQEEILVFVIVGSSLLMMAGLMINSYVKKKYPLPPAE